MLSRGRKAIQIALAHAQAEPAMAGAAPALLCADGLDHLAAAAALDAGDALMPPGGLQWLGDHGD